MTTTAPLIRWSLSSSDLALRPRIPSPCKQQPQDASQPTTSLLATVLAGYTAGVTGTLVGYPLDSLKVWQQTGTLEQNLMVASGSTTPKPLHVCRALYRGVASPLLTVGMVQSVYFSLYDATRQHLASKSQIHSKQSESSTLFATAQASAVAGFCLAVLTQPLLLLKTQQQVHGRSFSQALASCRQTWTRGMGPHVFSETLSRIVYMTTYEAAKQRLSHTTQDDLSLFQRMACAAAAGMLSWGLIFPLDVIRNRVYAACTESSSSVWQVTHQLLQREGLAGLYRGLGVTVLRAGPVAAAVLPIYDLSVAHWSQHA